MILFGAVFNAVSSSARMAAENLGPWGVTALAVAAASAYCFKRIHVQQCRMQELTGTLKKRMIDTRNDSTPQNLRFGEIGRIVFLTMDRRQEPDFND